MKTAPNAGAERFHQQTHRDKRKFFVVNVRVKLNQPDGWARRRF
jgi:hypothetical protein